MDSLERSTWRGRWPGAPPPPVGPWMQASAAPRGPEPQQLQVHHGPEPRQNGREPEDLPLWLSCTRNYTSGLCLRLTRPPRFRRGTRSTFSPSAKFVDANGAEVSTPNDLLLASLVRTARPNKSRMGTQMFFRARRPRFQRRAVKIPKTLEERFLIQRAGWMIGNRLPGALRP